MESALLFIGDASIDDIKLAVRTNDGEARGASAAASVREAWLGGKRGAQLLLDSGKIAGDGGKAGGYRVEVTVPGDVLPDSRKAPEGRDVTRSLFLNAAAVTSPGAGKRGTRGTPSPPPGAPAGSYRLSYRSHNELIRVPLASIGMTPGDVASWTFLHHGTAIPAVGVIGSDLCLYAPWQDDTYSATDSVFTGSSALMGSGPSPTLATRAAFSTLSPAGIESVFTRTRSYEEDRAYVRVLPGPLRRRFTITYNRGPAGGGRPSTDSIELKTSDVLTSTSVLLGVELYGVNQLTLTPDHYCDLTLEGVAVPRFSWDGQVQYNTQLPVTLSSLSHGGAFTLVHTAPSDTAAALNGADLQALNRVSLTTTGYPRADEGLHTELSVPGTASATRLTVGGFPAGATASDVIVLDVTDPWAPIRLTSVPTFACGDGTVGVEWEVPPAGGVFWAQLVSDIPAPEAVAATQVLPATPVSGPLTHVYIRPSPFAAALAPLVAARGPGVVEFDPRAAYDSFGYGQENPDAIRGAVAHLVESAGSVAAEPRVVLVGYGSADPRNNLGFLTSPAVPTYIEGGVPTSVGELEVPVDYKFGLLAGNDILPDAIVSRIPAKTTTELSNAVSRILTYEGLESSLRVPGRGALIVADKESTFIADQPAREAAWLPTGRPSVRVDASSSDAAWERTAMLSAWETSPGVALTIYAGHGNTARWGTATLLVSTDPATAVTNNIWPIMATFTCLNGYFAFPGGSPCFGESWLLAAPNRGAVAFLAPSGVDYYESERLFETEFLNQFALPEASRPRTIGEAFYRAQTSFLIAHPDSEITLRAYVLFGDPDTPLFIDPPQAGIEWETYEADFR